MSTLGISFGMMLIAPSFSSYFSFFFCLILSYFSFLPFSVCLSLAPFVSSLYRSLSFLLFPILFFFLPFPFLFFITIIIALYGLGCARVYCLNLILAPPRGGGFPHLVWPCSPVGDQPSFSYYVTFSFICFAIFSRILAVSLFLIFYGFDLKRSEYVFWISLR